MTPEQSYLFDINGFLHLKNILSEAEVYKCREAANQYISTSTEELSSSFGTKNNWLFENGFAWDKSLEALVFHPGYWPIVKELTDNRPRFILGSMLFNRPSPKGDKPTEAAGQGLHCSRENFGRHITKYDVRNDRIYCNDIVIFPYFTDVYPGDGGLVVVPGSHKSEFDRPETIFNGGTLADKPPQHTLNITPKAGDVVLMTELTTHGGLRWQAKDRTRITLALRYSPHYLGGKGNLGDTIRGRLSRETLERLSPETRELLASGDSQEVKNLVLKNNVTLS